MAYVDKEYLQVQLKNFADLIKEKFALKEEIGDGSGVLMEDLTATTTIGSITSGKTYPKGTPLEDVLRDMLITYQKAGLSISLDPAEELYDVIEDSLSSISIKASTTKGTNDIVSVTFYVDGEEKKKITEGVAEGGNYTYNHNFATPQKSTFAIKVTATDGEQATTVTKNVVFIGKSYYGTVADYISLPMEIDIKGLQYNTLKNSKKLIYSGIQVDYGKVLYAYPKSLGALTKIVDADGRDYTNSYTMFETVVDGIDYYAYLLTDAMGTDDGYQSFT